MVKVGLQHDIVDGNMFCKIYGVEDYVERAFCDSYTEREVMLNTGKHIA